MSELLNYRIRNAAAAVGCWVFLFLATRLAIAQTPANTLRPVAQAGFVPAHERTNTASAAMRVVGAQTRLSQTTITGPGDDVESVLAEPVPTPAPLAVDSSEIPEEWAPAESLDLAPEALSEPWPMEGESGCEDGGCDSCCDDEFAGHGPHHHGPWGKHAVLRSIGKHFQFFSGAHAFKNPGNRGSESSFGFQQGLNFSANIPHCRELSFQVGAQVTESNLNGSIFTDDDRIQLFATGGVFRRVDAGLQGGVVFDYLHEEWDYEVDLTQLRAELSWKYPLWHELGFFATVATRERLVNDPFLGPVGVDTTDLYAFFYRCRFRQLPGSETRIYGGFSNDSDGVVGGDFLVPVCQTLALQVDYAYLIPDDELRANIDESWNLSFNVVWYPGCGFTAPSNYCRPLFNVANNGSMMLNDQQ